MKLTSLLLFSLVVFAETIDIQKTLHNGNNKLTAGMFSEIVKKNQEKSVVLSAFSVITPISQLALASEGPSHDELLNAVGFPDDATTNTVFDLINVKFNSTKGVELKMASKLYIPIGYQVHAQFAMLSRDVYHSEIANIDFTDSESAANEINKWVEDQTNNRIKNLVDSGSISESISGVLVNALYFKGTWKYSFMDDATTQQDFHVNKQNTIQIPIMQNAEIYKYKESDNLQSKILELPYTGDQSSFVIILPNDVEGLAQLIEKLKDPNILDEETSNMWDVQVEVSIPKFKIETTSNLREVLEKINVTKLFSGEANLIKLLNTGKEMYISDAIQKAFIEINEKGAEAAAANAFFITIESLDSEQVTFSFVADHPFAYFLKVHDEILFNGVFYGS